MFMANVCYIIREKITVRLYAEHYKCFMRLMDIDPPSIVNLYIISQRLVEAESDLYELSNK